MCNCSTAYYLIAAPILITVLGLIIAIIITNTIELHEARKKKVRHQAETLIRDIIYFAVHLRLISTNEISNYQVETFNTKYNNNKDVRDLPEIKVKSENR